MYLAAVGRSQLQGSRRHVRKMYSLMIQFIYRMIMIVWWWSCDDFWKYKLTTICLENIATCSGVASVYAREIFAHQGWSWAYIWLGLVSYLSTSPDEHSMWELFARSSSPSADSVDVACARDTSTRLEPPWIHKRELSNYWVAPNESFGGVDESCRAGSVWKWLAELQRALWMRLAEANLICVSKAPEFRPLFRNIPASDDRGESCDTY